MELTDNDNRDGIEALLKSLSKQPKKVSEAISVLQNNLQQNLTKQQFLDYAQRDAKEIFSVLDQLQYLPYIDFSFSAPPIDLQNLCIKYLLESEDDPQKYLSKHLKEGLKYYLIRTQFWSEWMQYIGWQGARTKAVLDKDIELDVSREKGYLKKLSNALSYPSNFLLIPEKVYQTFKKWYSAYGGWSISRKVIKYKEKRPNLYNPNALGIGSNYTKFSAEKGDYTYELELHKYYFLGFRIYDDGEFPQIPRPSLWQRITGGKTIGPPFVEVYVSRYLLDFI